MKRALLAVVILSAVVLSTGCSGSMAGTAKEAKAVTPAQADSLLTPVAKGNLASSITPTVGSTAVLSSRPATTPVTPTAISFAPASAMKVNVTVPATVTRPMTVKNPGEQAIQSSPEGKAERIIDKPVLAFFWAEWCTSCQVMKPQLEALREEYKDRIHFAFINMDDPKAREVAAAYRVWAIPFFVLMKPSGEVVGQWVGEQSVTVFRKAFSQLLNQ